MKCPVCHHRIRKGFTAVKACPRCGARIKLTLDPKRLLAISAVVVICHFFILMPVLFHYGIKDVSITGFWAILVIFLSAKLKKSDEEG